jgi:hypothetical protein
MSIRNFIYFVPIIIAFLSIISIRLALKNKNKKINKYIITGCLVNILYLFIISTIIHNLLPILVGLEIIIVWFISIIGCILYMISIIICVIKNKKLNDINENKKIFKIFLIIILIPIIIFIISFSREMYLIRHSVIILSYESSGNGGIGDSYDFVYAINDKYCKEISIDVDTSYNYYNKLFLPNKLKEINEYELENLGINVVINNDNYIFVYKNGNLIHKEKINYKYFNIDLESIFYNE